MLCPNLMQSLCTTQADGLAINVHICRRAGTRNGSLEMIQLDSWNDNFLWLHHRHGAAWVSEDRIRGAAPLLRPATVGEPRPSSSTRWSSIFSNEIVFKLTIFDTKRKECLNDKYNAKMQVGKIIFSRKKPLVGKMFARARTLPRANRDTEPTLSFVRP